MARKWNWPLGSRSANFVETPSNPRAKRPRRKLPSPVIQELERRTLLSVTASLNSGVLDVNLSAANDQALITPSGSTISVSGTGFSAQAFSGVTSLLVQGANTPSQDDPNQSVTFGGSGGTITLHTASGTDALNVSGVTSVTFSDLTIDATQGNVDVEASETTLLASGTPQAAISVTGATIEANNITLDASASASYTYTSLGTLNEIGVAAAIANLDPSAAVTVTGSSTKIAVNGAGGNVTIGALSSATVNTSAMVGKDIDGSALNPVDAAIAESVVNSSAVAQVGGGSTVSAGSGAGTLSITSTNTTNVTTEVDGSGAAGGATGAVTLDNSTSEAFVAGGSTASGGTVDVLATTTNTADTTANSSANRRRSEQRDSKYPRGESRPRLSRVGDSVQPQPRGQVFPGRHGLLGRPPDRRRRRCRGDQIHAHDTGVR